MVRLSPGFVLPRWKIVETAGGRVVNVRAAETARRKRRSLFYTVTV